jgi:organic radical activating enzyme
MQSEMTRSGFLPDRTIHLHPTQTCNLACAHCYSESGPRATASLTLASMTRALGILRGEGYTNVSLSGGEPMMFNGLASLIYDAHAMGYRVTMISNGLFSAQHFDPIAAQLDGIAISFDGLAERHDAIRGRHGAFAQASATLTRLADQDRSVAAAISVTRAAIPELPDLVDHLLRCGAKALQIRPVALAGRAKTATLFSALTEADEARLFLVALALREELEGSLPVHCDLVPARNLWLQREDYAALFDEAADPPLADLVNPLVITSAGALKPMTYDFADRFDIAAVGSLSRERLHDYKRTGVASFRSLVADELHKLQRTEWLVDWFDHCAQASGRVDQVPSTTDRGYIASVPSA